MIALFSLFGEGGYRPKLGNGPVQQFLAIDDWWRQTVYVLAPTIHLSRRDIVLAAANKDGGAHVDERLTPDYELLITPGSLGLLVSEHQGLRIEQPISDGHFVALRQDGL